VPKLFPVQEIGSLAKPLWRTKGLRQSLSAQDLREAEEWAPKLGIDDYHDLAKGILKETDSRLRSKQVLELSTVYGLRLFEKAGLDNNGVGGEQQRVEMYEHVVKSVDGMEFLDAKKHSRSPVKVPITGPYTLVDWSFNEYYLRKNQNPSPKQRKQEARREFLLNMIEKVVRPEIRDLVDAGASWIQIDEPAVTTHPEPFEMQLFVEAWNETVRGFSCKFSNHTCYPSEIGYRVLADYAPKLEKCSQLALEFANRDVPRLGIEENARSGYIALQRFVENGFDGEFGVGAVHVHDFDGNADPAAGQVVGRDVLESPELVRDRVVFASKIIGDASKVWVNPDCGLRTRTWDVALSKLTSVAKGADLAREVYA